MPNFFKIPDSMFLVIPAITGSNDVQLFLINDPRSETGGLPLDSTAILHTFAGVQLWLRCPRHQG